VPPAPGCWQGWAYRSRLLTRSRTSLARAQVHGAKSIPEILAQLKAAEKNFE
jgi:hypothetical protein